MGILDAPFAEKARTSVTLATAYPADFVTTDYANDSLAFAAALLAAAGKELKVRPGTYTLPTTVSPASNTYIHGSGVNNTIIKMANGANLGYLFNCNSKTGITFKDLQLDGNADNQTGPTLATMISGSLASYLTFDTIWVHDSIRQGIYLGGAQYCTWINCRGTDNGRYIVSASRGEGFGFGINTTAGVAPKNNRFINCYTSGNYEGGISLYSDDITLRPYGNTVEGCTSDADPCGLNLWGADHTTVNGCNWRNGANMGIQVHGAIENQITGCVVAGNATNGIIVTNGAVRNNIIGNIVTGNTFSGINIQSDNNTISNNEVMDNGQHGIVINGCIQNGVAGNLCRRNGRDGINLTGAANNSIVGNRCQNNAQVGSGYYGIELQNNGGVGSTRNIVSSNWCLDNQATVIKSLLTANAASGQAVVTVADASVFVVNQFIAMAAGATTENGQILSIDSNTQVTLTANLTNSYTVAAAGVLKGRTSQKYGIWESNSVCDNNHITNNICLGNGSGQIVTLGANTVVSHNQTV